MLNQFLAITLFCIFISSPLASAEPQFNLGLGYGHATQEFGDLNYAPKAIAGHLDLQYRLWVLLLGVSYMTTTQYNWGDERKYVSMTAVNGGFALGKHLDLIGGVGWGKWRQRQLNQPTAPFDIDYVADGPGYMAGIRLHLIRLKDLSIGISATYYHMKSSLYTSREDGTKTIELEKSRGTGSIAAINFSWRGSLSSTK